MNKMDEVLFRSSQKLENIQFKLGIAATEGKKAVLQYSGDTKKVLVEAWNSPHSNELRESLKKCWCLILHTADEIKCAILYHINPRKFLKIFQQIFNTKWTKRDMVFASAGLVIGGIIGISLGSMLYKKRVYRYVQAIQCTSYTGVDGVQIIEETIAPQITNSNEVLINVKSGSIQLIDIGICRGYGKQIRKLLSKYYQYNKHDLPVTLGRDCAGVVTEIGWKVTRFDIGDEVWLTVPFWAPGTLSQIVSVPQEWVSRKPKTIGFEAASSLPYAGSIALGILKENKLTENLADKSIFIQGGCTPVGCILVQLLSKWGAEITTTCYKRAVPVAEALGAHNIIVLTEPEVKGKAALNLQLHENDLNSSGLLLKELELHDPFDVIINTKECGIKNFMGYLKENGLFLSTLPEEQISDKYDSVMLTFFGMYVKIKHRIQSLFRRDVKDFGEFPIEHGTLDELSNMVENGTIRTLVDRVLQSQEIEKAMYHIQSSDSIGSTVITFR